MKQTAVEWLIEQIKNVPKESDVWLWNSIFEQAKEMEKQQQAYSEEDLKEAFKQSRQYFIFQKDMPPLYKNFEEWFEQFKNK